VIPPVSEPGEFSYAFIPYDLVLKTEREIEQRQLREAKRKANKPARSHHADKWLNRKPFCFWDGEGPKDAGYALFGNSMGDEICHPFLSAAECLELIIERGRQTKAIHCWYGSTYDVSMMLAGSKGIGWRKLSQLKHTGKTIYRGYKIRWVPRKWLSVTFGNVHVKIFDVVSYFATKFQYAVTNWGVGTPEQIEFLTYNKNRRNEFTWSEIDEIKTYWRLELELGVLLMDKLRVTFHDAGFDPTSWHGPGGLARMALRRHKVMDAMAESPWQVRVAAKYAFAGGRFEMIHGGFINATIYNADIRSAYPTYAQYLPNLCAGQWRRVLAYESGKFGVYHIEYNATGNHNRDRIYPLFRRLENGEVIWPRHVEGWYWNPETELVANDPDAKIIEGWVFDEDDETDKPFAWIAEYFRKRMVLKNIGNPAEFTFKLIINSVYGQLAQRSGWDKAKRKAPAYHQLEWAGYITSACRARIYKLANAINSRALVSIDTDGIYATEALPVDPSTDLGGWEYSTYSAGLFWQSGIYILADKKGNWKKGKTKTRGIPKGEYSFDRMYDAYINREPIVLTKRNFIPFGLAEHNRFEDVNRWHDVETKVEFGGGNVYHGKRYHSTLHCQRDCDGDIHVFRLGIDASLGNTAPMSVMHHIPWQDDAPGYRVTHDEIAAFDLNDLDEDDDWAMEYEPA